MAAGISLVGWVALAAVAGTAAYSADQQRKGIHQQADALKAAQEDDARKAAEAETNAAVAANAQLADANKRRKASALGTGDPTLTGGLGGSNQPGAAPGAPTATTAFYGTPSTAGKASTGTALGAGAPASVPVNTRGGGGGGSTTRSASY